MAPPLLSWLPILSKGCWCFDLRTVCLVLCFIDTGVALFEFVGQVLFIADSGLDALIRHHIVYCFIVIFDFICNFLLVAFGVTLIIGLLKRNVMIVQVYIKLNIFTLILGVVTGFVVMVVFSPLAGIVYLLLISLTLYTWLCAHSLYVKDAILEASRHFENALYDKENQLEHIEPVP